MFLKMYVQRLTTKYLLAKFINEATDMIFTLKVYDDPAIGLIMKVNDTLSVQYIN